MGLKLDRKQLKKSSLLALSVLREEATKRRFLLNSRNSKRLANSLGMFGRADLNERTLLSEGVHKDHAARLDKRLQRCWLKIRAKQKKRLPLFSEHELSHKIAGSHLRFLTLVDTLTAVNSRQAISAAVKLKADLSKVASSTKGLSVLGAIEIEVVSMKMMRKVGTSSTQFPSEKRKLDVCEILESKLPVKSRDQESYFLIHFHGVIFANDAQLFDGFSSALRKVRRWSLAPRQIELKKLSEEYAGKAKSVENNLSHIATYITKGGNDWYAKKAYLRYKIGFEADNASTEEEWIAMNWRRCSELRAEHIEEGLEDILSLTPHEIHQLAVAIDGLMALSRNRTGYLISV